MSEKFCRAVLPHYVCAPIMGWARGKSLDTFVTWARKKGGTVEEMCEREGDGKT